MAMQIHWFSIINSCVTVLLLTGFLATILMRVLKNDFIKYTRDDEGVAQPIRPFLDNEVPLVGPGGGGVASMDRCPIYTPTGQDVLGPPCCIYTCIFQHICTYSYIFELWLGSGAPLR